MLFCHQIHYFMINALLSRNCVVPIYALFPPIFLCSKVDHRQSVCFLDVWPTGPRAHPSPTLPYLILKYCNWNVRGYQPARGGEWGGVWRGHDWIQNVSRNRKITKTLVICKTVTNLFWCLDKWYLASLFCRGSVQMGSGSKCAFLKIGLKPYQKL